MRVVTVIVLAVAALACATEPPARWGYLYESVIAPSCTTGACHSALARSGGLELHHAGRAFAALTGRECGDAAPASGYVNVDDPSASFLSILLRREGPTGMPPNGRLVADELALIELWMQRGAPCD